MKKQLSSKKLNLRKESIAHLNPTELNSVKGGFPASWTGLACANASNQSCGSSGMVDNQSIECE